MKKIKSREALQTIPTTKALVAAHSMSRLISSKDLDSRSGSPKGKATLVTVPVKDLGSPISGKRRTSNSQAASSPKAVPRLKGLGQPISGSGRVLSAMKRPNEEKITDRTDLGSKTFYKGTATGSMAAIGNSTALTTFYAGVTQASQAEGPSTKRSLFGPNNRS